MEISTYYIVERALYSKGAFHKSYVSTTTRAIAYNLKAG
jgi:hypothetical protein